MKVVILGLSGTGKTTTGKTLASYVSVPVLDVDDEATKLNHGVWPKNEPEVDKLFEKVNVQILRLEGCVCLTSFLELERIGDFCNRGFRLIELHGDLKHLLERRALRGDNLDPQNLKRITKNYHLHKRIVSQAQSKGWIFLSLDVTGLSRDDVLYRIAKALNITELKAPNRINAQHIAPGNAG